MRQPLPLAKFSAAPDRPENRRYDAAIDGIGSALIESIHADFMSITDFGTAASSVGRRRRQLIKAGAGAY